MARIGMIGGMSWESTAEYYRLANQLYAERLGGLKAAGVRTLGLLGTAYTMEQALLRDRLESHGLQVVVPEEDDRATVHGVIYDELCLGVMRDESRQSCREVIGRLVTAGAEGVALACTEIELLVSQADSPVPVFPTTRIHIEAAVDHVLRGC